jgi:flavin-dependent dehydrogenase
MPHAIVIGAGPAGSVAAIVLARGGWRVTLVEQHRFPRDKVCGECVSARGLDVLARLDLLTPVNSIQPAVLRRAILHANDGASSIVRLPRPMCGISRRALDVILLDAARSAGAEVCQPARCEHIESHPRERAVARCRDLRTNRVERIEADFMFVADGKAALRGARLAATSDLGIKAHFEGVRGCRDAIELFGLRGHYLGLAPVEKERWNIAFSVPIARVNQFRGDLGALFCVLLEENQALRDRLCGARRVTPWLASPLPRFGVAGNWPPRVIPIGNAAASIEPIGGEGMGLAMRSAEIAARVLIDANLRRVAPNPHRIQSAYRRLWGMRGPACRAAALAISSPRTSHVLVRAAGVAPMATLGLCAIGKTR